MRCAISVILLTIGVSGCGSPDFSALQGTAVLDEGDGDDSGPVAKALVVGDRYSPKLADFLKGRNVDVLDVPYTKHKASDIQVSGDYVVWSDNRNEALDIFGYQISTGKEFAISTAAGDQVFPQISGDYVVWEDHRDGNADIYGFQISTKSEFVISAAAKNQRFPQIDGDYVVWHDQRGSDTDVYAYRISTATADIPVATGAGDQWYPKISGDYIVWQHYENGFSDIYGYQISSQASFAITAQSNSSQFNPEIDGDYVVWVDNRNGNDNIYGYQISTAQTFGIAISSTQQWNPRLSGDYVVWQAYEVDNFDIHAYQLSARQAISPPVTTDGSDQILPAISGDYIVWQDLRNSNYDIYAYQISTGSVSRVTSNTLPQTNVAIDNGNIAWLDQQRGIIDVMHSADLGATQSVATNTWLTPAGIIGDVADYDVMVLVDDFVSDAVILGLFDAGVSAGKGILGLGGTGTSLAQVLANDSRYGVGVTPASGCWPMEVVAAGDAAHPLFRRMKLIPVVTLESSSAVTRDELAITMDASAVDKPDDVNLWAYFSNYMCNAAAAALVEFPAGDQGARILLDGTASMADGYRYWSENRWILLYNEIVYLKLISETP